MSTFILIAFLFVGYTYVGYPLLLLLLIACRSKQRGTDSACQGAASPSVEVFIAARNEAAIIGETLDSILCSDYPSQKLSVLLVSDASTDDTLVLAQSRGSRVKVVSLNERLGKAGALQAGQPHLSAEIVILADASGKFQPDTVKNLARWFVDPSVGSCVGKKRIIQSGSSVAKSDGLYLRYDLWLRSMEAALGSSLVGCEGGLTALRRNLLTYFGDPSLAEDYLVGCNVYAHGYRNIIDAEAVIFEPASLDMTHEFTRKVRVIVLGIRALFCARRFLNPLRHPMFFLQNISHRLCRWLVPFALIVLLLGSASIDTPIARVFFAIQVLFYLTAFCALFLPRSSPSPRGLLRMCAGTALYFTSMNLAALAAWCSLFRFSTPWDPSPREAGPPRNFSQEACG